jgi:hypothetical protein
VKRARRPNITPLDVPDALVCCQAITFALVHAHWTCTSWAEAEQAAVDLIRGLAADGYQLMKVTWQ